VVGIRCLRHGWSRGIQVNLEEPEKNFYPKKEEVGQVFHQKALVYIS
jgi:hypothetical protein